MYIQSGTIACCVKYVVSKAVDGIVVRKPLSFCFRLFGLQLPPPSKLSHNLPYLSLFLSSLCEEGKACQRKLTKGKEPNKTTAKIIGFLHPVRRHLDCRIEYHGFSQKRPFVCLILSHFMRRYRIQSLKKVYIRTAMIFSS